MPEREPPALAEMKKIAGTLPLEQAARLLACVAWVRNGLQLATDLSNWLIDCRDIDDATALEQLRMHSAELVAAAETVRDEPVDLDVLAENPKAWPAVENAPIGHRRADASSDLDEDGDVYTTGPGYEHPDGGEQ